MALDLPTLDEIHDDQIAAYRARFPDDDISRLSDAWKRYRTNSGALYGVYRKIQVAEDDIFPDTAEGTVLDRHGTIHGVTRNAATPARKSDAIRVTGTAASTVAIGDELTHVNGKTYQINSNETIPASPLYVDCDIIAVDTGEATKLDADETLTFTSPPAGIDAEAILVLDLDEDGEDEESDGAYRTRIMDKIAEPGMGGNANDYRTWALEVTGIAAAYVYPLRRGRGSVDLACLHTGTGSVRILTTVEEDEVEDYIDDYKPVHLKSFRVLTVQADAENVELTVDALSGAAYEFDWNDASAPTVLAWTAATRVMQLSEDVLDLGLVRGDRIVIKTAAGDGDGIPQEVEGSGVADGLAVDEIKLLNSPATAPVATDEVFSGGPLTATIRDAIIAHFDTLGPAIGDYGTGEWIDELNPSRLESIALAVAGVRDATCITPSSTVTPAGSAYPTDTTVDLLTPQEIIVRSV